MKYSTLICIFELILVSALSAQTVREQIRQAQVTQNQITQIKNLEQQAAASNPFLNPPLRNNQRIPGSRSDIKGAFGIELWRPLEERYLTDTSEEETNWSKIKIIPPVPLTKEFDVTYYVSLVPVHLVVAQISAHCDLKNPNHAGKFVKRINQLIRNKYPKLEKRVSELENKTLRWTYTDQRNKNVSITIEHSFEAAFATISYKDSKLMDEINGQLLEREFGDIDEAGL